MNLYAYVANRPLVLIDPSGSTARSAGSWISNSFSSWQTSVGYGNPTVSFDYGSSNVASYGVGSSPLNLPGPIRIADSPTVLTDYSNWFPAAHLDKRERLVKVARAFRESGGVQLDLPPDNKYEMTIWGREVSREKGPIPHRLIQFQTNEGLFFTMDKTQAQGKLYGPATYDFDGPRTQPIGGPGTIYEIKIRSMLIDPEVAGRYLSVHPWNTTVVIEGDYKLFFDDCWGYADDIFEAVERRQWQYDENHEVGK